MKRVALTACLALASIATAAQPAGAAGDKGYERQWRSLCNTTAHGIGTPFAFGLNCRRATIGGIDRRYVAWVPDAVAATPEPVPVVFMFHGSGGTGEQFFNISGWREVADTEGLITVFPSGAAYKITGKGRKSTKWHGFDLACEVDERVTPLRDDVAFTDAIIDDVAASEQVDGDRVYVSGFSSGAQFAQRLAVERGDRFAAVASSAGYVDECADGPPTDRIPTPSPDPAPAWANIGSKDDRALKPPATELSMEPSEVIDYWEGAIDRSTMAQGLDPDAHNELDFATWNSWTKPWRSWPDAQWTVLQWNALDTGKVPTEFVFSVLKGVGHHYPAAEHGKPKESAYVNIAEVFWQWFETYTLD